MCMLCCAQQGQQGQAVDPETAQVADKIITFPIDGAFHLILNTSVFKQQQQVLCTGKGRHVCGSREQPFYGKGSMGCA